MSTAIHEPRRMVAASSPSHEISGIEWWLSTVRHIQSTRRHQNYPHIDRAVVGRGGRGTRMQRRRARRHTWHVLLVDRDHLDHYTGTAAGVWVATETLSWGRHKGVPRKAGYFLPILGLLIGAFSAITAATGGGGDNMTTVWALVVGVLAIPGSMALLVYRRRRFRDRLWGADIAATERAGLASARTVLTPAGPRLYKTLLHEWARRLNALDPGNRLARLEDRFAA